MTVWIIAMMAAALIPIGFLWPKTDVILIVALAGLVVAYAVKPSQGHAPTVTAQVVPTAQTQGHMPVVNHP